MGGCCPVCHRAGENRVQVKGKAASLWSSGGLLSGKLQLLRKLTRVQVGLEYFERFFLKPLTRVV